MKRLKLSIMRGSKRLSQGKGKEPMRRIDRSQIESLLGAGTAGTFIATIFIASPQDKAMRKTGNPYHGKGMVKETALTVVGGFDYRAAVLKQYRKQLEAEGFPKDAVETALQEKETDFGTRKWGVKRPDRKFIDHKGSVYLACYVRSATEPVYRIGKEVIDAEKVKPFLPKKHVAKVQKDLDAKNRVTYRDVKLDSILSIRFKGEENLVGDLEPVTTDEQISKAKVNEELDRLLQEVVNLRELIEKGEVID